MRALLRAIQFSHVRSRLCDAKEFSIPIGSGSPLLLRASQHQALVNICGWESESGIDD
jgi:hypothetical protein